MTSTATDAPPGFELHGFQAGPDGFVCYGLEPEPIDYLFLRINGGRQSGKTAAGAMRAILYMNKFPGSLGMIVGLTTDKVRDTILPTLYKFLGRIGFRYGVHYEYNKTERALTFLHNNSVALMRSAEEPDTLPGPSLAWFWLDEHRKMPEKVFLLLQPTLTQVGYFHQAWLTSTPAGKSHWARKIFLPKTYAREFDCEVFPRVAGTYRSYNSWTKDNPHLSPVYYQTLLSTYGKDTALARQELFGEELVLDDLVFPVWNPAKHMVPESEWPSGPERVLAGVDFGFANPCAIIVEGVDSAGRHYILDEFYRTKLSEEHLCDIAKSLRNQYNIKYFVCDSADPRWIQAMRARRLPAIAAKKTVGSSSDPSSGIGLCYAALARELPDGSAGLYVSPKCTNFRREIENYTREENTGTKNISEKPRKHADHSLDAWRYAEIAIERFWGNTDITKSVSVSMEIA
jgi:phage terminase large subunit-like protein